ncbi:hypothetical protein ACUXV3_11120 [Roseobacteraceae bacterium NS-SX3]
MSFREFLAKVAALLKTKTAATRKNNPESKEPAISPQGPKVAPRKNIKAHPEG